MMAEILLELDRDIRELLSIVHNINQSYDKEKLEKALFLTNKIQAELYQMLR